MLGRLKNLVPPPLSRAWQVLRKAWAGWQKDDGFLLSAAMAYYAAFSLLPLCLVLIAVLGLAIEWSAQPQDAQKQLLHEVQQRAGPWLAAQIESLLTGAKSHAGLGGPLGIITLLVAALGVFLQLDYIFDKIWGTRGRDSTGWLDYFRVLLLGRLTAFLMLLAVGGLLILVSVADIFRAGIRSFVVQLPAGFAVWHWGETGMSLAVNALLVGLLYKVLPKSPIRWRDALAGGALVSAVWFLGQRVLVACVIGNGYSAYGVVGSFIAVMLWLYYAAATVFFGAEFVRALGEREGIRD
jgi:membrane protein